MIADTLEMVVWRARALPARLIALVLAAVACLGILSAAACGCKGSNAPTPQNAQAIAGASVTALSAAWTLGAEACVDVAQAANNDQTRQKCEAAFVPALDAIEAAAGMVDAWADADQANFPCALADILTAMGPTTSLLTQLGVAVPPQLSQGVALAQSFLPMCARDGGAPDAAPEASPAPPPPSVTAAQLERAVLSRKSAMQAAGVSP